MKKKWTKAIVLISIFLIGGSIGIVAGYKIASGMYTVHIEPIMIFDSENESVEVIYDYVLPVDNETVVLTKKELDENESYIHVNNSLRGNCTLVADGVTIKLLRIFNVNPLNREW